MDDKRACPKFFGVVINNAKGCANKPKDPQQIRSRKGSSSWCKYL